MVVEPNLFEYARIGGPNAGADHRWAFAEFVPLHDGDRTGGQWLRTIEAGTGRLRRLGVEEGRGPAGRDRGVPGLPRHAGDRSGRLKATTGP
ncbi:MAG TPA: hypothetical protein VGE74_16040 [Gemmata sp.]